MSAGINAAVTWTPSSVSPARVHAGERRTLVWPAPDGGMRVGIYRELANGDGEWVDSQLGVVSYVPSMWRLATHV